MFDRLITILVTGLTLSMAAAVHSEPADPLSLYTDAPYSDTTSSQTTLTDTVSEANDAADKGKTAQPAAAKQTDTPEPPVVQTSSDADSDTDTDTNLISETPSEKTTETSAESTAETTAESTAETTTETEIISTEKTVSAIEASPDQLQQPTEASGPHPDVINICQQIGNKLGSVSAEECLEAKFAVPRFYSNNHLPLLEKHFPASVAGEHAPRILFLGGIHGDEYSSVSISFKWLKILQDSHNGNFDWHFMPLANPDGLLRKKSTRVNAHNVDLNRNFIPAGTSINPLKHWQTYAKKRARYYPGARPLSEPETQAIHQLINQLRPDVIVSVHAPHGILDYDGTITPPRQLGPLQLKQLGTYPGSLGNYGWFVKQIPVMTIELKHAGIMPSKHDIDRMWSDLIQWSNVGALWSSTGIER